MAETRQLYFPGHSAMRCRGRTTVPGHRRVPGLGAGLGAALLSVREGHRCGGARCRRAPGWAPASSMAGSMRGDCARCDARLWWTPGFDRTFFVLPEAAGKRLLPLGHRPYRDLRCGCRVHADETQCRWPNRSAAGRRETGHSVRSNALEPGFHGVPAWAWAARTARASCGWGWRGRRGGWNGAWLASAEERGGEGNGCLGEVLPGKTRRARARARARPRARRGRGGRGRLGEALPGGRGDAGEGRVDGDGRGWESGLTEGRREKTE
jgi:hypothetical protein